MNYTYDATGQKLRKQFGTQITDYAGGIQYTSNSIEFIQTEEGRAIPGSSYTYEYFLKDHLGNTRAVVKQDGTITQVQDYYAFGLEMNPDNQFAGSPANRYTYNETIKSTGQAVKEYAIQTVKELEPSVYAKAEVKASGQAGGIRKHERCRY